MPVYLIFVIN